MNAYAKHFDKNSKYMNLLVNDKEYQKNILKYGIKLKFSLKKILIVNQYIMINTLKLEQKFTIIEYIQIFNIIKYPKIKNIVRVYL